MIPDEIGQRLHDRATRGEALSAGEEEQLRRWYARLDSDEMAELNAAPVPSRLTELQSRVQQATAEVVVQAQRIEALTAENTRLSQEIDLLQCLLAAKPAGQPA
jgi:hypothetical protein